MQFQDELAGGVVLIRPALQSPDYVTGVSGWAIKIDGSAEFSNIVIRGGGTADPIVVGNPGSPQVIIRTSAGNGLIVFPTNRPIEQDAATVGSAVVDPGAADERAELQITGPTVNGAPLGVRVVLGSRPQDGSDVARLSIQNRTGTDVYFTADGDQVLVTGRPFTAERSADTFVAMRTHVTGEAQPRHTVLANGSLEWGPGSAGSDTNLYRAAAGILQTDDTFVVLGEFAPRNLVRGERPLQTDSMFESRATGDARARWFSTAGGLMWWGDGTALQDTNLFRNGPNELKTNDSFTADGNLVIGGSSTVVGSATSDNERHGTAQTPAPGAGGGTSTIVVNFADAMPATPRVTITPVTTVDPNPTGGVTIIGYVDAVSTAGFTIRAYRSTNAATNWSYNAHSD